VRKIIAGLSIGLGAAAIVLSLGALGLLDVAELKAYDRRIRAAASPEAVNKNIALVEINDTTIQDMEPIFGHWPWPRVALSYVITYLHRAQARVVAVDLTLSERDRVVQYDIGGEAMSGKQSDQALVDAVKAAGNVILLADVVSEGLLDATQNAKEQPWLDSGYHVGNLAEPRPVVMPPFAELAGAAAGLGHNFLPLDTDGPARRMPPFVRHGDKYLPSLGIAAALMAGEFHADDVREAGAQIQVRDRRIPLASTKVASPDSAGQRRDQWNMLVNYRAPSQTRAGERPYPSYSFRRLFMSELQIEGEEKPMVDPSEFKGKIVFLGFTASGLLDKFNSPFGDDNMPGIFLHASMADSVLASRFITPASSASRVLTVLGASLAVGLVSALLPFAAAAAGAAVILGGWTWYAFSAFKGGLWLTLVQPLAAGAIALFAGTAYRYFVEGAEKRMVKNLFGRFVSKDVVAQLAENPELAQLGGKRRDMSVLFSDIRGFTTVTEGGKPEELVAQLNEYFSRMVEVVFRHKGTVDKFVGDMVMALFGAPLDDPDHAEHAVQAAIDMIHELGELNKDWAARGMTQLDIGIGVNSGDMIAGNIGSASAMSYTVIGDNVNLGSRLESLNKDYKTRIIISEATKTRLTRTYETRPLGDVKVKGKTKAVAIHEIVVPAPFATTEEQTL